MTEVEYLSQVVYIKQAEDKKKIQTTHTYIVPANMTSHCVWENWAPADSETSGVDDLHRHIGWCCSGNLIRS